MPIETMIALAFALISLVLVVPAGIWLARGQRVLQGLISLAVLALLAVAVGGLMLAWDLHYSFTVLDDPEPVGFLSAEPAPTRAGDWDVMVMDARGRSRVHRQSGGVLRLEGRVVSGGALGQTLSMPLLFRLEDSASHPLTFEDYVGRDHRMREHLPAVDERYSPLWRFWQHMPLGAELTGVLVPLAEEVEYELWVSGNRLEARPLNEAAEDALQGSWY